jgi:hypothetical protein
MLIVHLEKSDGVEKIISGVAAGCFDISRRPKRSIYA